MAEARMSSPLDTLQLMISDVLVSMGKALKSSQREGKRVPLSANSSRLQESDERFNAALDDLEQELLEAKAVLYRDLDRVRAKSRPVEPEPAPVQLQAPPPPMLVDESSISDGLQPLLPNDTSGQVMNDHKPIAPFPNMDLELSAPIPLQAKVESRSPQPAAKMDFSADQAPPMKIEPPALTVPRTASPNLTKASPAAKVESPASVVSKPMAQQGPLSAQQDSVFGADAVSANLALGQLPQGNPELNFTDMQFSLASAAGDSQTTNQGQDNTFDLDAFLAEQSVPSAGVDVTGANTVGAQVGVAAMDIPMPTVEATKEPAKADDANMDDLFDLNGTSMDLGLDSAGADGTTNFDEMFFGEAGDTDMGEFDNAYFGLDG